VVQEQPGARVHRVPQQLAPLKDILPASVSRSAAWASAHRPKGSFLLRRSPYRLLTKMSTTASASATLALLLSPPATHRSSTTASGSTSRTLSRIIDPMTHISCAGRVPLCLQRLRIANRMCSPSTHLRADRG
jgi:hypothetical protein